MGVDREKGKPSTTEYEVAERLGNHTLVRIYPLTGRRHQIRVHLYSLGHPVAGDMKYGRQADQSVFPRLMLHASEIRIRIPSGKDIRIEAPVPESFSSVLMGLHKKSAV
jgi:23S rRNA-/tRNA-specific pseudouridylate synthase